MPLHVLLAHLPAWAGLLLFTLTWAVPAVVAHYVFRKAVSRHRLLPSHDVAGFLIAIVGVIYAVVLGFVVVNVWVAFDNAQRTADLEAGDLAEAFTLTPNFPNPTRSRLQKLMADYAFEVRDDEWPMLREDRQDLTARKYLIEAYATLVNEPIREKESIGDALKQYLLQQHSFDRLQSVGIQRRERLIDAGSGLDQTLYLALVTGGIIVLAFSFLFGVENQALQLTMTAFLAASIGLLFSIIVSLDRPYSGSIRVNSEAWTLVIENNHLADYR